MLAKTLFQGGENLFSNKGPEFFISLFCLHSVHFLLVQKNEPKKDAHGIRSFRLSCAPQSCRDFKNSLCSNSLKSLIDIFCGAQQIPNSDNITADQSRIVI